jgi:hypothetical protein
LFVGVDNSTEFSPSTLAALSLCGFSGGVVKRLRGFRKDRHTVPDAVNSATQAFFTRLCAEELAEEAESWFQRARDACGYKRREISLEINGASALLLSKDFSFEITWALEESNPGNYTVTRVLRDVKEADFVLSAASDTIFSGAFSQIIFTLARGVSVEAVIDAVESLPDPATLSVSYPANCSECTLRVPCVDAVVRCTGATLELVFPRAGSPRELVEAFGEVRAAFRFTQSESLAGLL